MIKLSEEAKAYYSKYIGQDGKLIIDDSLPDQIKETFRYFNDNNINIMTLNADDSNVFSDDVEELGFDDEDSSDGFEDDNTVFSENSPEIVEDGNVDVDSLNDLF